MVSFVFQSMTLICTNKLIWCDLPIELSFVCVPFSDLKAFMSTVAKPKCPSLIRISKFDANIRYKTRQHVSVMQKYMRRCSCNCREQARNNMGLGQLKSIWRHIKNNKVGFYYLQSMMLFVSLFLQYQRYLGKLQPNASWEKGKFHLSSNNFWWAYHVKDSRKR